MLCVAAHADPLPHASFEHWCAVANMVLEQYVGYALADIAVSDDELRIWHAAGIPARIVGSALTVRAPKVRYTLSRWYDDRPKRVLRRLHDKMKKAS